MFTYVRRRRWVRIRKLKLNLPSSGAGSLKLGKNQGQEKYLERAEFIIGQATSLHQLGELNEALSQYEEGIGILLQGLKSKPQRRRKKNFFFHS